MEQQRTEMRSITAEQQKRVEEVCFRSLALIGRNCEYLEQHFDRTGADESTRQAVAESARVSPSAVFSAGATSPAK